MIRSLAEIDAIDEFHATLAAHTIFTGATASTASGVISTYLPKSLSFELTHFEPDAELGECFLTYKRKSSSHHQ